VGGIGESVFFPTQPQVSELEWQFERYLNATGCSGSTEELRCPRSKDTTVLQAANIRSPYPGQTGAPLFYWTPTIDGDFIQDHLYCLIAKGKFVKVPIIFRGKPNSFRAAKAILKGDQSKTTPMKALPSQPMYRHQQHSQLFSRAITPT
jgi:hypothetical protein